MFSTEFRERLRLGKYSRWAVNLTEPQLEAILWMIGEYGYRAHHVLPLLTGLWDKEGTGRAVLALEELFRVVGGDRPELDALRARVRTLLAEVRGYAEDRNAPPAHSWPVEWQGLVVGCLGSPILDEFGCSCSGVWWPAADEAADFQLAVRQPSAEVLVILGGIRAWVKSAPDESGRMNFGIYIGAQEWLATPHAKPDTASVGGA
jgi:hypothetical protein